MKLQKARAKAAYIVQYIQATIEADQHTEIAWPTQNKLLIAYIAALEDRVEELQEELEFQQFLEMMEEK